MSDLQMLDMPSRRFWSMERQITRVMAEKDFRHINVNRATISDEAMKDVVKHLTLDLGETLEVERQAVIKPQGNFADRLSALSGAGRKK